MSARRQGPSNISVATPVPSSARSAIGSQRSFRALPDYVFPSAPLNNTAISALDNLCRQSSNLEKLKTLQTSAAVYLSEATSGVFEQSRVRRINYEKAKTKLAELEGTLQAVQGHEGGENLDGDNIPEASEQSKEEAGLRSQVYKKGIEVKQKKDAAEKMKQQADQIYEKAELRLRQAIDGKVRVLDYEGVLAEVSSNVRRGEGRAAPTQSTLGASQFYERPPLSSMHDEQRDEQDQLLSQPEAGVLGSVKGKLQQREASYAGQTMGAKYAEHPAYVAFKSAVHDAFHEEDGVDLPHSNTWFASGGDEDGTGPSSTLADMQTQKDDADSDIEIAGERISTRCPITLVYMKDPITSPCKHNFETSAILEMLRQSSEIAGGQAEQRGRRTVTIGGEKIIRCPVTSCAQRFTESMLRRDPMMRRKIQRLQRREKERERSGGSYDDDDEISRFDRAVSVSTDVGSRRESSMPRVKQEIRSSMAPRWHATPSMSRDESVNDDDAMDEEYDDHGA